MAANPLKLIRNSRVVMKLAPKRWPANLPPPVMWDDTAAKIRAVSILCTMFTRDGEMVCAWDMTPDQARDVVRCCG